MYDSNKRSQILGNQVLCIGLSDAYGTLLPFVFGLAVLFSDAKGKPYNKPR